MSYLEYAIAIADGHPGIPDEALTDWDLENLAECAAKAAAADADLHMLIHVASADVPRLLREIVRLRAAA